MIYIGLIAYTIYQALPSQRETPVCVLLAGGWRSVGSQMHLDLFWHYKQFPLTLVAMLVLLATLIVIYLRLGIGRTTITSGEKRAAHLPFSIYLGWITVATVANVSDVLYFLKWDRLGIAPEIWMSIVLAAVLVIALWKGLR